MLLGAVGRLPHFHTQPHHLSIRLPPLLVPQPLSSAIIPSAGVFLKPLLGRSSGQKERRMSWPHVRETLHAGLHSQPTRPRRVVPTINSARVEIVDVQRLRLLIFPNTGHPMKPRQKAFLHRGAAPRQRSDGSSSGLGLHPGSGPIFSRSLQNSNKLLQVLWIALKTPLA
jgi:hypothetical protein